MSIKIRVFKIVLTLVAIGLNVFDLVTDFLNGLDLIGTLGGKMILSVIFLPAFAAIALGFYQDKVRSKFLLREKTSSSFEHTLVFVNWFELKENEDENENKMEKIKRNLRKIGIVFLVLLRIYSVINCTRYIVKLCLNEDKEKLKKLEQRIRADEFLDAVFESLPQCCVQLYIFGLHSTVTHLQVVSLFSSVITLLFEIVKISVTRELLIRKEAMEIYHISKKRRNVYTQRKFSLKPMTERESMVLNAYKKRSSSLGKISKGNDDETMQLSLFHNYKVSKKILVNLEYTFDKENREYFITEKIIRAKQKSIKIENNLFYFIRIFHIFVEGFTFFVPSLPAVALFSSLYGTFLFLLYVPVAGHFVAEFWWWRAHTYKKRFTMAFYSLFYIFKFLERMFIVVMISVWFIKVIDYSKSPPPHTVNAIPSMIYPKPNPFLKTIASYEKDGSKKDWAKDCYKINKNNMTIDLNRIIYSEIPFCAIDPSTYIFCAVFYINVLGFFFDIAAFLVYHIFNEKFKEVLGQFEEDGQKIIQGFNPQTTLVEEHASPDDGCPQLIRPIKQHASSD